jgi:hypothetical protein
VTATQLSSKITTNLHGTLWSPAYRSPRPGWFTRETKSVEHISWQTTVNGSLCQGKLRNLKLMDPWCDICSLFFPNLCGQKQLSPIIYHNIMGICVTVDSSNPVPFPANTLVCACMHSHEQSQYVSLCRKGNLGRHGSICPSMFHTLHMHPCERPISSYKLADLTSHGVSFSKIRPALCVRIPANLYPNRARSKRTLQSWPAVT